MVTAVARSRRRNLFVGVVVGAVGVLLCASLYVLAKIDEHRYDTAASCRAFFALTKPLDGTCRIASLMIVRAYDSHGRFNAETQHLVLANQAHATTDIEVGDERRGNVVDGFVTKHDRDARAQYLNDEIVLIQTKSGVLETDAFPTLRQTTWIWFGIALGIIGLGSASILLRQPRAAP